MTTPEAPALEAAALARDEAIGAAYAAYRAFCEANPEASEVDRHNAGVAFRRARDQANRRYARATYGEELR